MTAHTSPRPAPPRPERPLSTSNLVQPDRTRLMHYARAAHAREPVVDWLETRLAEFHGVAHAITVCNGFWALVLAIGALAIPGRSDVLMPSLTYRRLADVAAWARLRPRFCEVDPASLAADAQTMRAALHPDVALLLAVHPIIGVCDVAGLEALARETRLPLLFDSVESVFEHTPSGKVGRFGAAECFSLHASKLLNGAEGGYVTTNDPVLAARLQDLRNGATHDGLDARLHQLHAAMALAALDGLNTQTARNRERYLAYQAGLADIPGLRLVPFDKTTPTSWKNILIELLPTWPLSRDATLQALNTADILARAYYHPPLHQKPMAYPHVHADLPTTDDLARRFLLLPCGHHVEIADIALVLAHLRSMSQ